MVEAKQTISLGSGAGYLYVVEIRYKIQRKYICYLIFDCSVDFCQMFLLAYLWTFKYVAVMSYNPGTSKVTRGSAQ
jgi:hypothetical protein